MPRLGEGMTDEDHRAERAISAAAGALPSWRGAAVSYVKIVSAIASPMHSGVDGDGYRVDVVRKEEREPASFYLKLYAGDTAPFLDLPVSFHAAAGAGRASVAPLLLWSDPGLKAALWEFRGPGWRTAIHDDSWNRAVVPEAARSLRRLHAQPLLGHQHNVFERLEAYVGIARAENVTLPDDFEWTLANVRGIRAAIAAAGADVRPCHGDLIASNMLIGPKGQVELVDWDEACDSDPYWDLGMYFAEAFPFDDGALAMLEDYGGKADRRLLARCRLYGIAGDVTWAVRSLILAHRTQRLDVEYFKYGQWRALRARVALHDQKFEHMLRTL
jgi:thiamine kinase-like enzyme